MFQEPCPSGIDNNATCKIDVVLGVASEEDVGGGGSKVGGTDKVGTASGSSGVRAGAEKDLFDISPEEAFQLFVAHAQYGDATHTHTHTHTHTPTPTHSAGVLEGGGEESTTFESGSRDSAHTRIDMHQYTNMCKHRPVKAPPLAMQIAGKYSQKLCRYWDITCIERQRS